MPQPLHFICLYLLVELLINSQSLLPAPDPACQTTSWARIVAGGSPRRARRMNLQFLEPSLVDGVVHVAPPSAVIEDGSKDWSDCLVGYFIGSKLPFNAVNTIARKLWAKDGLTDVLGHNTGFIFFRFSSDAGANAILEKGPWLFAGRYLALKKWEPGLKLYKDPATKIPVWINLHNVPLEYWNEEGLNYLASAVGGPPLCRCRH